MNNQDYSEILKNINLLQNINQNSQNNQFINIPNIQVNHFINFIIFIL